AYVDQTRDALPAEAPLWSAISDGQEMVHLGKVMVPARAYAARFGFTGDVQQRKVGVMSGGERNRIHLARLIRSGANVLLLDEPTNDLDVNTIRALEDALEGFAGCAVIVTHDRWFLDRVATHIMAFEGDSRVVWHEGNYADYLEDRRRRLGLESDTPRRPKYRRFTR
ncbi:MAG: ATP-binding cassette domain-containing protein, partial [Verrucomicrobiota bacterium]